MLAFCDMRTFKKKLWQDTGSEFFLKRVKLRKREYFIQNKEAD